MADRKFDHQYTSPKSGEGRKPSPKRKPTPPPTEANAGSYRSDKISPVGGRKYGNPSPTENQHKGQKGSPSGRRRASPSPTRERGERYPESRISPGSDMSRKHSPGPKSINTQPSPLPGPRQHGQRRDIESYQHIPHPTDAFMERLSPSHHMSAIQQMERKYSPIPFSGYMEPKVVLNRLEVAIPPDGSISPFMEQHSISPGSGFRLGEKRVSPTPSHLRGREISPLAVHHFDGHPSPSPDNMAHLERKLSPAPPSSMDMRVSPGPAYDQRLSLSPLPPHAERRPSPAHMPERMSPMPILTIGRGTPPPAHTPHQKPSHKAPSAVHISKADLPGDRRGSPVPAAFSSENMLGPPGGARSSLSPGSFVSGEMSRLSPTPGFIERKLSPSRDGRPTASPLKAYLLQAVPESERRSPNRNVDERRPSPTPLNRESGMEPIAKMPRMSISPHLPRGGFLPPKQNISLGLQRRSPSPSKLPLFSDRDREQLSLFVPSPHHMSQPIVRISPSGPSEPVSQYLPPMSSGSGGFSEALINIRSDPLLSSGGRPIIHPIISPPYQMRSPPGGGGTATSGSPIIPVPGKPLLTAHLGGAPFVPQGLHHHGPLHIPQPAPAFISQGLVMHAQRPPFLPHPSHPQPLPGQFPFPGSVLGPAMSETYSPTTKMSSPRHMTGATGLGLHDNLASSHHPHPKSQFIHKSMSDVSPFTRTDRHRHLEDHERDSSMPRLTPEPPLSNLVDGAMPTAQESHNLLDRKPDLHLPGLPGGNVLSSAVQNEVELVQMPNPLNMRVQTLNNFPTSSTVYRSTYRSQSVAMHRARCSSITSAAKSLDILRQNLQKSMNREIDVIMQKYLNKFFKPGIENIKLNNGVNAVSEEHVHAVSRQILEEAKKMYISERARSVTPVRDIPDNTSDTGSTGRSSSRVGILSRKRRPSDSDSELGMSTKRKKKGRPPHTQSGRATPSKTMKSHSPVRKEGPKWDTERLKSETTFVMGARANKALGLGATRGRLYIKHPDVFKLEKSSLEMEVRKYSGDQDDKQWLFDNHHMPATGGKAYMLLVEDIQELAETDEYRDSPNLLLDEIVGFTIPDWMIEKMKMQMTTMRTDVAKPKVIPRSRSGTPNDPSRVFPTGSTQKGDTKLPFASFSTPTNKHGDMVSDTKTEPSPSNTEEMELLSTGDNDDQNPSEMSPFNMGGGFDDVNSPVPSDLDGLDDASFHLAK